MAEEPKKTAETKKITKKKTSVKKTTKKTSKKTTKKSSKKTTAIKKTKEESKNEVAKVDVETEADVKLKEEAERKKKLKNRKVKEGDMVFVDILGKTIEDDPKKNIVFQASNPEDAQMLPNYDPKKIDQYVPDLAIIGKQGFLMDNVDNAIKEGIKFFEEKTITLEPADAFGERVGNKIEKVSAKQFKKDMNEEPRPGATYNDKKGRRGTVLRAAQGRLLVDFNHPLAGKKIEYRIKVIDLIEGFENKVKALLGRRIPGLDSILDQFKIDYDEKESVLEIELPQMFVYQIAQQQGGLYFKMGASMDIQEHLGVNTVKFVEVYAKPPTPEVNHDHSHEHDHEHDHD
ncbi:MAG: FKBP-type peptidyl-prolyl cis-trans isomerase [Promethearchaeota archaeon]